MCAWWLIAVVSTRVRRWRWASRRELACSRDSWALRPKAVIEPQGQELAFGWPYQLREDAAVSSTAAAKPTPDLCQFLRAALRLAVELRGPAAALLRDVGDERKRFFAPSTRWWHP